MKQPPCPSCHQDESVIKSGLNRTGSQRYRCQACRRYFTPDPKPEGYDLALRKRALQLYLEGTSLRAIGRLLGIHHQSVSNWVTRAADALPATVTDATPSETIELDERYPFVQQKKTKSTSSSPSPAAAG
ncbi:MAG TPA: helix-turn-helix domain-containing protein [Ktedonobacterales bacterium]|jgi:transposase